MSNFILAGLFTEGSTDVRFLSSIVERTLLDIAFECTGDIETDLKIIDFDKSGRGFVDQVLQASKLGYEKYSMMILFVHTDSDNNLDSLVFDTKIIPAQNILSKMDDLSYCKHLVAIVPIQMTESWMLADKKLLKEEIGINKSDAELGLNSNPETVSNPKKLIQDIIRLSKEELTKRKRRRGLDIADLYQIIGQKIELDKLDTLPSFVKFKNSLIQKLKELNLYHN
jgi:hypothetical protein